MNQVTAHPPMRQAIEYLHRIEARPGVICGSIATCFPLADIPDMGCFRVRGHRQRPGPSPILR